MDTSLIKHLDNLGINYKIHEHPPVFTVEEAKKLENKFIGVAHTKNLFLKDEAERFYLVCIQAGKRLNLKSLKEKINAKKKLSFGTEDQLKKTLHLTPGSVSIFGMIYAKDVILVIDKEIWQAKKVGFHPNVNTATLELTHEDLEKFINSLKLNPLILDL